jgi:hypothetical protein
MARIRYLESQAYDGALPCFFASLLLLLLLLFIIIIQRWPKPHEQSKEALYIAAKTGNGSDVSPTFVGIHGWGIKKGGEDKYAWTANHRGILFYVRQKRSLKSMYLYDTPRYRAAYWAWVCNVCGFAQASYTLTWFGDAVDSTQRLERWLDE